MLCVTADIPCSRANKAAGIDFRRHSRKSGASHSPARYGVRFRKVSVTEKNSATAKKMDDVAENHNFVVPHHRHLFAHGRMSDTGLWKHAVSGRIKVAIRAKRGGPGRTRIRNQTVTVERHLPIVQAAGREKVRMRVDKPALITARAPTAAPGAAPKQFARRTSSTPPHCEAANNIRAGVSRRPRPQGSATCRPE